MYWLVCNIHIDIVKNRLTYLHDAIHGDTREFNYVLYMKYVKHYSLIIASGLICRKFEFIGIEMP